MTYIPGIYIRYVVYIYDLNIGQYKYLVAGDRIQKLAAQIPGDRRVVLSLNIPINRWCYICRSPGTTMLMLPLGCYLVRFVAPLFKVDQLSGRATQEILLRALVVAAAAV